MSNIDERVVSMKFDNAQFEHGIKTTLASLDALNKSLKLEGATKGLADVHAAGKNVQLGHIADSVDHLANKFSAMSVTAITALVTIAHQAAITGLAVVKSLTIDPISTGFREYETNINSIQTILANTGAAAVTMQQVIDALQELNLYADQTIYNFAQMAKNIGTFTAAGVALEPAVAAIKGIANLAALSGSNSEQASMAMYQLSQALATGTVRLIDWNSVVNAGMGGTVFQRALAQTAVVMGTLNSTAVELSGTMQTVKINGDSFRNSLQEGWLTTDVLSQTLAQFTGDLTDAELAVMGYSQTQIEAIQKQAAVARAAATEVKTMSALLGSLRESAGSGWGQTWQLIFGNFEEAKALWTGVYGVLDGIIGKSARSRNQLLTEWKSLGGRDNLFAGIANVFKVFGQVLEPIGEAFRLMFPKTTGKQLADFSASFKNFTALLVISAETADKLRRTFAGVFAIFGIGYDILKQVIRVLFELFSGAGEGAGNILSVTANIGDFLVALRKSINEGQGLIKFFDGIKNVIEVPIKLITALTKGLATLFEGFDVDDAAGRVSDFALQLGPLGTLLNFITYAWTRMGLAAEAMWNFFEPMASKFVEIWTDVAEVVGGVNFGDMLAAINTGTLVAFLIILKDWFGRGGITGVIGSLTSALNAMQTTLQAATLLQIAIAVGVLAVAISILSNIDSAKLAVAMSAIAIMFTQLLASLAIMTQFPSTHVVKIYVMAAAMTVLAIAINILALAVKSMSSLDWDELARGLTGVTVLLAAITAASVLMPDGARLISTGLGIVAIAFAIKILASAVHDMVDLNWEEMARGLTGVAALLGALTLFTMFANANATGILSGAGIVLLATGIKILASAVQDLSSVSWENIGKGIAVLAASLVLISAALIAIPPTAPLQATGIVIVAAAMLILAEAIKSMSGISWENVGKGMAILATSLILISAALIAIPPTAPLQAAGVLIVATAIVILAKALEQMGGMNWGTIVKGLVTLAGALAIVAVALIVMSGTLSGAFALLIVSSALVALAGVLKTLGGMSWGEIVKGLVTLALAFTVLGVAALVLQPVIPAMLGLGAAVALLGLGLALAGAGVLFFATALTALSIAGAAGVAAFVGIISAVIGLIPTIVKQIGIALLILIDVLVEAVPKLVELIVKLIVYLLDALDDLLPKLSDFIYKLILVILDILEKSIPKIVEAGLHILIGILKGMGDNIGRVVDMVTYIITQFLNALGRNIPKIVNAGFEMIIAIMDGITKAINQNSGRLGTAGADMAWAIVRGAVTGFNAFGGQIGDKLLAIAKNAWHGVLNFFDISSPAKEAIWASRMIVEGLTIGLKIYSRGAVVAAEQLGEDTLDSLRGALTGMADVIPHDMDMTPIITPVLDLSDVERKSADIWKMLDTKPFRVEAAYSSARQAADGYQQNQDESSESTMDDGDTYNFNQYNTSPKALSTAEIYRNTKNQLSTAKGVLPN